MDHVPSHTASSPPVFGLVIAAVGVGGYLWTTALNVFLGAASMADGAASMAGAAVPPGSWTMENVTQTVMGGLALAGGVIAWVQTQRQKAHADKIQMMKDQADAARDRKREDAAAAMEIWMKEAMARWQIEQVKQHAATREHLMRQDAALDAVKQAVASPPLPAAQPPVVVITQPATTTAAATTDSQDSCQEN